MKRLVKVGEEQVIRAARIYRTSEAAGQALGIHATSFNRLCKKHDVESPGARRKREKQQHKSGLSLKEEKEVTEIEQHLDEIEHKCYDCDYLKHWKEAPEVALETCPSCGINFTNPNKE